MGFLLLARLGVVIEASPLQPWGETADTPGRRTAQAKDATAEKGHHCLQTLSGPGLLMLGILTLWLSGLAGGWICTLYGSCCTTGVYIDPWPDQDSEHEVPCNQMQHPDCMRFCEYGDAMSQWPAWNFSTHISHHLSFTSHAAQDSNTVSAKCWACFDARTEPKTSYSVTTPLHIPRLGLGRLEWNLEATWHDGF